jgi:hypothetical protein
LSEASWRDHCSAALQLSQASLQCACVGAASRCFADVWSSWHQKRDWLEHAWTMLTPWTAIKLQLEICTPDLYVTIQLPIMKLKVWINFLEQSLSQAQ